MVGPGYSKQPLAPGKESQKREGGGGHVDNDQLPCRKGQFPLVSVGDKPSFLTGIIICYKVIIESEFTV